MKLKTVLILTDLIIKIGRFDRMYRKTMNIAKGVGMGVLAGVTVAAVSTKMMGHNKKATHMRKSAGKAMHTVGNIIGDIEKVLK